MAGNLTLSLYDAFNSSDDSLVDTLSRPVIHVSCHNHALMRDKGLTGLGWCLGRRLRTRVVSEDNAGGSTGGQLALALYNTVNYSDAVLSMLSC